MIDNQNQSNNAPLSEVPPSHPIEVPPAPPVAPPPPAVPPAPQANPPAAPAEPVLAVSHVETKPRSFLIPLVIGFVLVLVGAAAFFLTRSTPPPAPVAPPVVVQPTAVPFFLSVDNLQQEVAVVNGELVVSGKTLPNTTVLIYSDTDETSLQSGADGSFESTIVVNEVGESVRVSAITETGEQKDVTFVIDENTEVLGESDRATEQEDTGDSEESLGDVKASIQATKRLRKIEQKDSEETEVMEEEMEQEDVDEALEEDQNDDEDLGDDKTERIRTFIEMKKAIERMEKIGVNRIREIVKEVSTQEASMQEERQVRRMIAREASTEATLRRSAVSGVVVAVDGSALTIVHQIQRDRSFVVHYNADTVITTKDGSESEIPVFTEGMRIAAVGEPIDGDLLAKRIHVMPGKASGVMLKQPLATDGGSMDSSPSATVEPSVTVEPLSEGTEAPPPDPALGVE